MSAVDPAVQRQQRAAVAQRVMAQIEEIAASLQWDALDAAPAWLALPAPALAVYARRLGAALCVPALRMWIDRARIDAAQAAVGASFWPAVLALRDMPALRPVVATQLHGAAASQISGLLQALGSAVLLASVDGEPWRAVAAKVLAPVAGVEVTADVARRVIRCVDALQATESAS